MTEDQTFVSVSNQTNLVSLDSIGLPERYRPEEIIGSGGMGIVIRAEDQELGNQVAIKILNDQTLGSDVKSLQRFTREAQVLAQLNHMHIVQIKSVGLTNDRKPFQVMELLNGRSLQERLREGPLSLSEFKTLMLQLIEGLEYASSRGIVHRDIKPSNVLLVNGPDDEPIVKLVDFGIARHDGPDGPPQMHTLTETSAVVGSPLYMSPEQCRGQKADFLSDIYSLGCVMYECLTGKPPIQGDSPLETMYLHCTQEVTPLASTTKEGTKLGEVIAKCLQKNPTERPQSYAEIADAISASLSQLNTSSMLKASDLGRTNRNSKSSPWLIVAWVIPSLFVLGIAASKLSTVPPPKPVELADVDKRTRELYKLIAGNEELLQRPGVGQEERINGINGLWVSSDELGQRLLSKGDYSEAEKHIRRCIEIAQTRDCWEQGTSYERLGRCLFYSGNQSKWKEAETCFTLALALMDENKMPHDGTAEKSARFLATKVTVFISRATLRSAMGAMKDARKDVDEVKAICEIIDALALPSRDIAALQKEAASLTHISMFSKFASPRDSQDKLDLAYIYLTEAEYLNKHVLRKRSALGPISAADKLLAETKDSNLPEWQSLKALSDRLRLENETQKRTAVN